MSNPNLTETDGNILDLPAPNREMRFARLGTGPLGKLRQDIENLSSGTAGTRFVIREAPASRKHAGKRRDKCTSVKLLTLRGG